MHLLFYIKIVNTVLISIPISLMYAMFFNIYIASSFYNDFKSDKNFGELFGHYIFRLYTADLEIN